ncbi:MAG TPA: heme peroxidase family protein [Thermoanaerobaculia bacterium]
MPRIAHGEQITTTQIEEAVAGVFALNESIAAPIALAKAVPFTRFDFMFPALQNDPKNLLSEEQKTVQDLIALGETMHDPAGGVDGPIPAVYTYLGQFIDHDITLEESSGNLGNIFEPATLKPAALNAVRKLRNTRTATLDLDSVYDPPAVRDGEKMKLGQVTPLNGTQRPVLPIPGKDAFNDLPRRPPNNTDLRTDREALIGDPRNDENLVVAQLHTAFLRAHNAIVDKGKDFKAAQVALRHHYQWIVVHDFLPRVCDPKIVEKTVKSNRFFTPSDAMTFMPFEFAVAAYRFGHSMVRATYDHNINFPNDAFGATLDQLFTFTALQGDLGPPPAPGGPPPTPGSGLPTLPDNWVIQWERFVEGKGLRNPARAIDTKLVEPLFALRHFDGTVLPPEQSRLAVRNLLRGYLLRMPTGQAVAKAMKLRALSANDILKAAANPQMKAILKSSGFHKRTPLWFYVLIEAAALGKGRLGPVGSTIVAEVLIALVRRTPGSFLSHINWKPTLGKKKGVFTINDLLRLGGAL